MGFFGKLSGLVNISNVVGGTLLLAGLSKFHSIQNAPSTEMGMLRPLLPYLAAFELTLAAWLFSGVLRNLAYAVTAMVFLIMTLVTSYKVFMGYKSCGCFGNLQISPWMMLVYDFLILAIMSSAALRHYYPGRRSPETSSVA
jgi:hypothetical protein